MAKKAKAIPKYVQNMFNKPQYKVGDAVCMTWLGMKKYGFIIQIKKSHEEVAYFVRANDTTYPCGIKIKEYTTKYHSAGLVQHDCAESQDAIARKAATSNTRVVTDSNGTKIRTRAKTTVSEPIVSTTSNQAPTKSTRTRTSSRKNAKQSGSASSSKGRSRKSAAGNSAKLDDAIQRQKDFLNGFTRKE